MDKKEALPVADKNEIIVYQPEGGEFHIEVRVENETVWLTQAQMAELFSTSRTNIVEHIGHIYDENELDAESTCRKFRQVQIEGSRKRNLSLSIHTPTTWFFRLCRSATKEWKRPSILPGLPVPCGRRKPA